MNKAEEFFTDNGISMHGYYGEDSPSYSQIIELAQLYADEQSREAIIEFFKWCMDKDEYVLVGKMKDGICNTSVEDLHDEWKSNQEDKG